MTKLNEYYNTHKEKYMTRQIIWDKYILDEFVDVAMLTKEEEFIIRTRVQGWTISQQADELGMSISTVNRINKRLKLKYDEAQKYSLILPKRKSSAKELRM